ncbi:MAG: CHAT domain-containing protein [Saprospirales bacterium]|nr:MAG: CHAT domain-containing protein [Saprospirales bacterium]
MNVNLRMISIFFLCISLSGILLSGETKPASTNQSNSDGDQLTALYNEGWQKSHSGDNYSAAEIFEKGREIILNKVDTIDYQRLVTFNEALGYHLIELGRYREALEILYSNLEKCTELECYSKWDCKTVTYSELTVCYGKMGLQQIAVDYLLKASEIDKEHFSDEISYHFANYRNLAYSYNLMGNYRAAEEYFEKTIEILFHPDVYHPMIHQSILLQLMQLYINLEKLQKADQVYAEFLELNKDYPFSHEGLVYQTQIEVMYFHRKGDYQSALLTLEEGLQRLEGIRDVDPHFYCNMYNTAAEFLIKMDKFKDARHYLKLCEQKIKPFKNLLDKDVDDLESLMKARNIYNYSLLKEALKTDLPTDEKEALLIDVYRNAGALADLLEYHLSSVFIPLTKNKIVRDFMSIFETGIHALYELSNISDPEKWAEKALRFSDRSRAILLIEHLMYKLTENQAVVEILIRDNHIKQQYDSVFLDMIQLPNEESSDNQEQRESLAKLASLRLEREQLFRNELRNERQYIREVMGGSQIGKDFIPEIISNDISLLTHFFGEGNMYIIALSQKGYFFEKKAIDEEAISTALHFRQEIERLPDVYGNHEAFHTHLGALEKLNQKVFNYFVGEAVSIFNEYLLFIAVDEASVIPLGALKKPKIDARNSRYIIEYTKIFGGFSLKNLELQYENIRVPKGREFTAFAPEYNNEVVSLAGIPYQFSLPALNFNINEVKWLSQNLSAQAFIGEEATIENFKSVVSNSQVLHLSGHAYAHDQYPELSFFAFYIGNDRQNSNYLLRLIDIEKMDIPVNLIFLNGCETGFGPILRGEGPESVHRAFALAGVSSLINTLWPINDLTGLQMTKTFYKKLYNKGKTIPAALRYAQLEMIQSNHPVYSHPYFWSGYQSYGIPDNPFRSKMAKWHLWLPIGILVLILLYYGLKKWSML